jgi:N4-gp56 family major capsid protein
MAELDFGTNDSQTVKIWGKKLMKVALGQTLFFKKFLGTGEDALIYWHKDLEKANGDQIKYDLLVELGQDGVTGSNELEGNEENLDFQQDTINIEQLRHATGWTLMSSQRTVHDLRDSATWALGRWWARKFESYMFRYLCGDITINHAQAGGTVAGTTAYDSNHVVYAGSATSEATLTTNDRFTLPLIDYCIENAKTQDNRMVPVMIDGKQHWVMVLHPFSVTDLKLNVGGSTSSKWMEIQREANNRGKDNPIFTGALGVYNNTILFESQDIFKSRAAADASGEVRRNLFLAARAGCFAMGNAYDKMEQKKMGGNNLLNWFEYFRDANDKRFVKAGCVFGIKKSVFDGEDYGTITVPCYAKAAF